MTAFRISLVVAVSDLANLVAYLNLETRDGYIERNGRLGDGQQLVTVAVSDRDDAGLIRRWVNGCLNLAPGCLPEEHDV